MTDLFDEDNVLMSDTEGAFPQALKDLPSLPSHQLDDDDLPDVSAYAQELKERSEGKRSEPGSTGGKKNKVQPERIRAEVYQGRGPLQTDPAGPREPRRSNRSGKEDPDPFTYSVSSSSSSSSSSSASRADAKEVKEEADEDDDVDMPFPSKAPASDVSRSSSSVNIRRPTVVPQPATKRVRIRGATEHGREEEANFRLDTFTARSAAEVFLMKEISKRDDELDAVRLFSQRLKLEEKSITPERFVLKLSETEAANARLEASVSNLQGRIRTAETVREGLAQVKVNLTQHVEHWTRMYTELQEQYAKTDAELKGFKEAKHLLVGKMAVLEANFNNMTTTSVAVEAEKKRLETEVGQLKQQQATQANLLTKARSAATQWQTAAEEAERKRKALEESLAQKESDLATTKNAAAFVKQRFEDLEKASERDLEKLKDDYKVKLQAQIKLKDEVDRKVDELQREVDRLDQAKKRLERERDNSKGEASSAKTRLEEAEDQLKTKRDEAVRLANAEQKLKGEMEDAQRKYDGEIRQLKERVVKLLEDAKTKEADLDKLKSTGTDQEKAARESLVKIQDENRRLSKSLEDAKSEARQAADEVVSKTRTAATLMKEVEEYKKAQTSLESTNSDLARQISSLKPLTQLQVDQKTAIDGLQRQVEKFKEDLETARASEKRLADARRLLEDKVSEKDRELIKVVADRDENKRKEEEVNRTCRLQEAKISQLQTTDTTLKSENTEAQRMIAELREKLAAANEELKLLRLSDSGLRRDAAELRLERDNMRAAISTLNVEKSDLDRRIAVLSDGKSTAERIQDELKRQLDQQKAELRDEQQRVQEAGNLVAQLNGQLGVQQAEYERKNAEFGNTVARIKTEYESLLEQRNVHMMGMRAAIEHLQDANGRLQNSLKPPIAGGSGKPPPLPPLKPFILGPSAKPKPPAVDPDDLYTSPGVVLAHTDPSRDLQCRVHGALLVSLSVSDSKEVETMQRYQTNFFLTRLGMDTLWALTIEGVLGDKGYDPRHKLSDQLFAALFDVGTESKKGTAIAQLAPRDGWRQELAFAACRLYQRFVAERPKDGSVPKLNELSERNGCARWYPQLLKRFGELNKEFIASSGDTAVYALNKGGQGAWLTNPDFAAEKLWLRSSTLKPMDGLQGRLLRVAVQDDWLNTFAKLGKAHWVFSHPEFSRSFRVACGFLWNHELDVYTNVTNLARTSEGMKLASIVCASAGLGDADNVNASRSNDAFATARQEFYD